ncbi:MAG: hypothetical protein EOM20_04480 [Spartobacteria bacterium]|nr:hypothetical protein [Spartobacteria bacterium]
MHLSSDGTIIYRSGMNPKVNANFRIFTPLDFIAAITSHIPDKSFQLVRYYGWYSKKPTEGRQAARSGSNGAKRSGKMRGQRDKLAAEEAEKLDETAASPNIIDVSEHKPRRIPLVAP